MDSSYSPTLRPNNAALTHTLSEFVTVGKNSDDQTYYKFSILDQLNGILMLDWNVIDEYSDILNAMCVDCELSDREFNTYKYLPDLLAYDVYGSTQLDFIILKVNDMVSNKEFDRKRIKLPYASQLRTFLAAVNGAERGYLNQNRIELGIYGT